MKKNSQAGIYPLGEQRTLSVREAKAHFSSLVERAAEGEEITITWHGQPRARLVPCPLPRGAVLKVDREWLKKMAVRKKGSTAEKLIRQDRNDRG